MKTIIPYTKEISLNAKVAEITSISLEHEIQVEDEALTGDFIISGDYKAHEISVNREAFTHRLPFSVELGENVDTESIEFEILDFTYELLNEDTLKANIEFSVSAEEKEIVKEEQIDEYEELNRLNEEFEEFMTPVEEEKIDIIENQDIEPVAIEEERLDQESETTILNAMSNEEGFTTYHIHIVKETETIESICAEYNVDLDFIKNYNNVDDIITGDKLLIPEEIND